MVNIRYLKITQIGGKKGKKKRGWGGGESGVYLQDTALFLMLIVVKSGYARSQASRSTCLLLGVGWDGYPSIIHICNYKP